MHFISVSVAICAAGKLLVVIDNRNIGVAKGR